jgi:hypothetical protein
VRQDVGTLGRIAEIDENRIVVLERRQRIVKQQFVTNRHRLVNRRDEQLHGIRSGRLGQKDRKVDKRRVVVHDVVAAEYVFQREQRRSNRRHIRVHVVQRLTGLLVQRGNGAGQRVRN